MRKERLNALINLLDDTDYQVYNVVREKLLDANEKIIPDLQIALDLSENDLFVERAFSIINDLRYKKLDDEFIESLENKNDLLYLSFLISKYKYPNIEFEEIENKLDDIVNEIKQNVNFNSLTGLQQIRRINYILYVKQKFSGDFTNVFNPKNSYINKVLERKKGNDISLAIIYLFIAQKLNLPVYGIDFPGNFLLVFKNNTINESLFYINPINKGAIVTKKDIDDFIKNNKIRRSTKHYEICEDNLIVRRLTSFLMHSYIKKNDVENTNDVKHLLSLIKR